VGVNGSARNVAATRPPLGPFQSRPARLRISAEANSIESLELPDRDPRLRPVVILKHPAISDFRRKNGPSAGNFDEFQPVTGAGTSEPRCRPSVDRKASPSWPDPADLPRSSAVPRRRTLSAPAWLTTWRCPMAFVSPGRSGSRRSPRHRPGLVRQESPNPGPQHPPVDQLLLSGRSRAGSIRASLCSWHKLVAQGSGGEPWR
jgi:hypothetical protein